MAIAATSVWEFRSTATAGNTNGGFFKTGASGVDYSQQNAAQYALTGLTSAGAGSVILTASAATDMVGNGIYIVSGTNFTTGWYEITAVSAGVSITTDRAVTTGVGATGVGNVGGAMSLNSTLDDDVYEVMEPGNVVYMKLGTFTLGEVVATAKAGTTALPIMIIGYNSTRGDTPITAATRPTIACTTNSFTAGGFFEFYNINFTGSAATLFAMGTSTKTVNCKFYNNSTTANRIGVSLVAADTYILGCEIISSFGHAVSGNNATMMTGNYVHNSNNGCNLSGNSGSSILSIVNNIFENNKNVAITTTTSSVAAFLIFGNTFYGGETPVGTAMLFSSGTSDVRIISNIIYGFATGVSHADSTNNLFLDYNCYFNNTTNRTNVGTGVHDTAVNPTFTSVQELVNSTGTTSGSVLTDAGANWSTVTDGVDFCFLVSGTGITAGMYLITSHTTTTLTLDNAPGTNATANKVSRVITGHNFGVGTNVAGSGFPNVFPAGFSTSYTDIGAVQRQPTGSSAVAYGFAV